MFARQPEILGYLRDCAQRFGVIPHIRFGHEVDGVEWDDATQRWRIQTRAGPFTARALVAGGRARSAEPSIPKLPGLDRFAGKSFHSAQWDHDHDLTGKRVAVIGTGASAIQFVPQIQPKVEQLYVFQRTPPWVLRAATAPITERREAPAAGACPPPSARCGRRSTGRRERGSSASVRPAPGRLGRIDARGGTSNRQVADPELRAKLTPDYRLGCKRVLGSDDYYPALTQPNVERRRPTRSPSPRARDRRPTTAPTRGRHDHLRDRLPRDGPRRSPSAVRGRDGRIAGRGLAREPEALPRHRPSPGSRTCSCSSGPNTGLGTTRSC